MLSSLSGPCSSSQLQKIQISRYELSTNTTRTETGRSQRRSCMGSWPRPSRRLGRIPASANFRRPLRTLTWMGTGWSILTSSRTCWPSWNKETRMLFQLIILKSDLNIVFMFTIYTKILQTLLYQSVNTQTKMKLLSSQKHTHSLLDQAFDC